MKPRLCLARRAFDNPCPNRAKYGAYCTVHKRRATLNEQSRSREQRLDAAREGVVKALEELEREALSLRQHWTCDKCPDHNVYAACEAARAALKELEEASK